MKLITLFLVVFQFLVSQTVHKVVLTWSDPNNPTGTQYNVYRQTGSCPATEPTSTQGFTKLNTTAISGFTYNDTPVSAGTTYCYIVTATNGTVESLPSPDASASVIPFSPASLSITVN